MADALRGRAERVCRTLRAHAAGDVPGSELVASLHAVNAASEASAAIIEKRTYVRSFVVAVKFLSSHAFPNAG
jgi:hypothetical protein